MKTTDLRSGMKVELRNKKVGTIETDVLGNLLIYFEGWGYLAFKGNYEDDMTCSKNDQLDIMKVMSKDGNGQVVWTREEKKKLKFEFRKVTKLEERQALFKVNEIIRLKKKNYPLNPFGGLTWQEYQARKEALERYRNGELLEVIDIYKGTDNAYYYEVINGPRDFKCFVHEDAIVRRGTTAEQRAKWFTKYRIGIDMKQAIEKRYIKVVFKNETEKQLLKIFEDNEPDYLVHYEFDKNVVLIINRKYSIHKLISWNKITCSVEEFLKGFYK